MLRVRTSSPEPVGSFRGAGSRTLTAGFRVEEVEPGVRILRSAALLPAEILDAQPRSNGGVADTEVCCFAIGEGMEAQVSILDIWEFESELHFLALESNFGDFFPASANGIYELACMYR